MQARTQELAAANESLVAEVAERMQTEASLEQSRQALQKLAFQLLRVQEEERRRISRDLHDDINQRLALLAMDIEAVGRKLNSSTDHVGRAVQRNTGTGGGVVRCGAAFGLSASSVHSR